MYFGEILRELFGKHFEQVWEYSEKISNKMCEVFRKFENFKKNYFQKSNYFTLEKSRIEGHCTKVGLRNPDWSSFAATAHYIDKQSAGSCRSISSTVHIVVVMKKPPMCQIMRFSLYFMNRSIEGRRIG